jgi:hypothetical protein
VTLDTAAKRATFENEANDFPKAFTYQLAEPDHLRITLRGIIGGKPATEVYDLRHVKMMADGARVREPGPRQAELGTRPFARRDSTRASARPAGRR